MKDLNPSSNMGGIILENIGGVEIHPATGCCSACGSGACFTENFFQYSAASCILGCVL